MKKRIVLIWDLDGFIGLVNSTMPYSYNGNYHKKELDCVERSLELLNKYAMKSTFAITGFSAEKGIYPYTFPDLIEKISSLGHEIASHSWRHEWVPFLSKQQFGNSLLRSKIALESATKNRVTVNGFVPPHNKPSTWILKGAYSIEDRALFPFYRFGDLSSVFTELKRANFKWIRISQNPFLERIIDRGRNKHYRVFFHKGLLILRNHRSGFSKEVIDKIISSQQEIHTVSAHPAMLGFEDGRAESWGSFESFAQAFANRKEYEFITPQQLILEHEQGIH